jgi:3,4-dihydroxy 2-butanone 4-phosphate synthase/GTP cyclohydrolase II
VLLASHQNTDDLRASIDLALGRHNAAAPVTRRGHTSFMTVGLGSQILRDLGIRKFRLMGAPVKYNAISGFGLEVAEYLNPE